MDVMEEVGVITREQRAETKKQEQEERTIPSGKWRATVFSWNLVDDNTKADDHPFKGHPLFNVGLRCYDCPTVGETRSGWVKITSSKILNEKGKPVKKYKAAEDLVEVMDKFGEQFSEALEQAKVTPAIYSVGVYEPEGTDKKYNYLHGVSAA